VRRRRLPRPRSYALLEGAKAHHGEREPHPATRSGTRARTPAKRESTASRRALRDWIVPTTSSIASDRRAARLRPRPCARRLSPSKIPPPFSWKDEPEPDPVLFGMLPEITRPTRTPVGSGHRRPPRPVSPADVRRQARFRRKTVEELAPIDGFRVLQCRDRARSAPAARAKSRTVSVTNATPSARSTRGVCDVGSRAGRSGPYRAQQRGAATIVVNGEGRSDDRVHNAALPRNSSAHTGPRRPSCRTRLKSTTGDHRRDDRESSADLASGAVTAFQKLPGPRRSPPEKKKERPPPPPRGRPRRQRHAARSPQVEQERPAPEGRPAPLAKRSPGSAPSREAGWAALRQPEAVEPPLDLFDLVTIPVEGSNNLGVTAVHPPRSWMVNG